MQWAQMSQWTMMITLPAFVMNKNFNFEMVTDLPFECGIQSYQFKIKVFIKSNAYTNK